MNESHTVSTDHTGVTTIIAHHEKGGARPASLRLSCPVKLNKFARTRKADGSKIACPFTSIVKHSHVSAIVNFDYAGNVNRQRDREGKASDFEAESNWFEHVTRAIVAHKQTAERYIFVRVLNFALSAPFFTAGEADETVIDRASLVEYLPADDLTDEERAAFGLGAAAGNAKQDLESEIFCITFKLRNVREIVIDGFRYLIAPDASAVDVPTVSATRARKPRVVPAGTIEIATVEEAQAFVRDILARGVAAYLARGEHANAGQF